MNKLLTLTITTAIAVVVLATVLMPVLQDYEDGVTKTYSNVGAKASAISEDVTITYDGTTVTVGGDSFPGHVPMMSDAASLIFNSGKTNLTLILFGVAAYPNLTALTLAFDVSEKTATGTYTTTTVTTETAVSFTWTDWCFVYDADGDYVTNYYTSSSVNTPVYFSDINEVHAFYRTSSEYYLFDGTSVTGTETGTADLDATAVSGVEDVSYFNQRYNFSGLSYTNESSTTIYAPYVCAKATVSGMSEADDRYVNLFAVIPVMIIMAILVGVAAAALRRD